MTRAPSDAACAKAWDRIMAIAQEHALVCQAAGGTALLAIPDEQRKAGIRDRVLRIHLMEEEPAEQGALELGGGA